MPSANTRGVPIALHSTRSARGLLHTIPFASLITKRDRPGKWPWSVPRATFKGSISHQKLWAVGAAGAQGRGNFARPVDSHGRAKTKQNKKQFVREGTRYHNGPRERV